MNSIKNTFLKGYVVSNKMNKTIVVKSQKLIKHNKYKKFMKIFSKFFVHDENNDAKIGDIVLFKKTKPISKNKNCILIKIHNKKGDNYDSNAI